MKILFAIVASCLFFLTSCTKEPQTDYQAFLKNETIHQIQLKFYYGGSSVSSKQIALLPGVQFEIANGNDRGIVNNGGFDSKYFSASDSLQVLFDSSYTVSHYFLTPNQLLRRSYLYISGRNIFNYLSYNFQEINLSKHRRQNVYTYVFTEADYLFAKN